MFSHEIQSVLEQHSYNIDVDTYVNICRTSPQITRVKYEPFGSYFEIWTKDNCYWKFNVYRKEY